MITVVVDGRAALAKFSPAGIPEAVRRNMRAAIPGLLKDLAAEVNKNLNSGLQSRTRVQIKKGQGEMVENASGITGRMEMIWTGDQKQAMVPEVLESGSKPHVIAAVNAKSLAFYWPVIGGMAFFKQVMHPGFPGIHYMENAFESMKAEIVQRMQDAVMKGTKE